MANTTKNPGIIGLGGTTGGTGMLNLAPVNYGALNLAPPPTTNPGGIGMGGTTAGVGTLNLASPNYNALSMQPPQAPSSTVNPNASFQNNVQGPAGTPQPSTVVNVNTPSQSQNPASPATQGTQPSPSTMPPNGSVVDLLNASGQDSSYAARQQLAQQYGIQGYTGSAAQNTDLANKYIEAHKKLSETTTPDTGSQARTALDSYFEDNKQQEDPQKAFFDQYMSMNPVVKQLYDQVHQALSTPSTTQTFQQQYQDLLGKQGIPGLQTDLMNIKNIMDGTEDDIRTEIGKAGGFATESQVQALTGARNKTLLVQANQLQQQLALKEDYVNQIMQFSQMDRKQVNDDLDRKLGLTEKLADIQEKMTTAAKGNYQKVVDEVGYQGLANALAGDKQAQQFAEQSLGLPKGILSNPTAMKYLTPQVDQKPFQFVGGTENQAPGVFDPNTGVFTPRAGGGGGGGSGAGGGVSSSVSPANKRALDIILGSGKFTKAQAAAITSAVNSAEDPFVVIRNQAKALMTGANQTKVESYETAQSALNNIETSLNDFYKAGGTTDVFKGTYEKTVNKLGEVSNPKLVELATQIQQNMQIYRNAVSGTAYSVQEGTDIASIFPGINKTEGLNKAIIAGRKRAFADGIDGAYKGVLGGVYDELKNATAERTSYEPGTIIVSNGQQYKVGSDGETIVPVTQEINWNAINLK